MTIVLLFCDWFWTMFRFVRDRPASKSQGLALKELELAVGPYLQALYAKQLQLSENPWRRAGCPPVWRVRDGDLTRSEKRHVYLECSYCRHRRIKYLLMQLILLGAQLGVVIFAFSLVWMLSKPEVHRVVNAMQPEKTVATSVLAVATDQRERVSVPLTVPGDYSMSAEERRMLDVMVRSLPPELEFKARLGSAKLAREFQNRRKALLAYVGIETPLAARLDAAWFEALRQSGNGGLVQGLMRQESELSKYLNPDSLVVITEKQAAMAGVVGPRLCSLLKAQTELARKLSAEGRGESTVFAAVLRLTDDQVTEVALEDGHRDNLAEGSQELVRSATRTGPSLVARR